MDLDDVGSPEDVDYNYLRPNNLDAAVEKSIVLMPELPTKDWAARPLP